MSLLTAILLALLAPTGHTGANHATSAADAVAPCASTVVSVWRDDPAPCDVRPGQRLDVFGVTLAACDDMGGEYIGTNPDDATTPATFVCEDVDY